MNVKAINEALRRVVVPTLSKEHVELFTAGVRALAYALEKGTTQPTRYDWKDAPAWASCVVKLDSVNDMLYWFGPIPQTFAAVTTPHITFNEWLGECALWEERPVITTPTFTDQLSELLDKVYDNEESFLAALLPGNAIAVNEVYLAAARTKVVYQGRHNQPNITTTIKTSDFMAWAEDLNDGK
jgi:hypothetical protein